MLPLELDRDVPNLGKFSACRRVARSVYMGSAPLAKAAHRGLEDRHVKLGCVMPGESPAVFGDALRRLAGAATYLYQDGPRYWYSTQPTVTKLAEDRAEQLKRDADKVVAELEKRLRKDLEQKGDFSRIHAMPESGQDVSDDRDARLVVLRTDYPYSKDPGNAAVAAANPGRRSRSNPRGFAGQCWEGRLRCRESRPARPLAHPDYIAPWRSRVRISLSGNDWNRRINGDRNDQRTAV